jgi:protein ImuA
MRGLVHSGAFEAKGQSSAQARLADLRRVVERLHAAPTGDGRSRDPREKPGTLASRLSLAWPKGPLGSGQEPDWGLPANLAVGALNQVVAGYPDLPAAYGFLFALTALGLKARAGPAVLVAARRALAGHGAPYGHGLAQLGLDVGRLILVETETDKDALWALEETLRSEARPAMVAGALAAGPDLTASRRLNLAAAPPQTPLVLLCGAQGGAQGGTSAAATRWRIAAAPAARDRFGALAGPRWRVALERSRLGHSMGGQMARPGAWLIEWNHVAHRFRVVEGLADRPSLQGTGLRRTG